MATTATRTRATTKSTTKSTTAAQSGSENGSKAGTARSSITDAKREELRESVDVLIDEIVNGDDTHWQAYADKLAAERTYGQIVFGIFQPRSANNTFYLAAQARKRGLAVKGLYAGAKQWKKRGRSVRDGEQPFHIFGPPTYTRKRRDGDPEPLARPAGETGEQGELVTVWRGRAPVWDVYDWTQTVADDPDVVDEPDFTVPLSAGDEATLAQLVASAPVPVHLENLGGTAYRSYLTAAGITVDSSLSVANQIFALVGELAHLHLGTLEVLDSTRIDPAASDFTAEKAAAVQAAALAQYLGMKMLGLDETVGNDLTEAAGAHLKNWVRTDKDGNTVPVEGHKTKRKLVVRRFDAALKAADQVVGAYLAQGESDDAPDGALLEPAVA